MREIDAAAEKFDVHGAEEPDTSNTVEGELRGSERQLGIQNQENDSAEAHTRKQRPRSLGHGVWLHGAEPCVWSARRQAGGSSPDLDGRRTRVTLFDTAEVYGAQKVATKLLKAGLVREIKAKTGMEIWRRDEETGQAYSLKLTDAGLKAIAADERGSQSIPSTAVSPNTNDNSSKAKTAANMAAARSATAAPTATAPRQARRSHA